MRISRLAAVALLPFLASCATTAPAPKAGPPPPADCPEVYRAGDAGIQGPVSDPGPTISDAPRGGHVTGIVHLRALIDCEGYVRDIEVIDGPPAAVERAIEEFANRRFEPATLDGRPVSLRDYAITIRYR